ncbi:UNVERIFIED_CONTAM: putative ribonuclease H protein [Sesamum calycinum]|uniref:Ribonuclease H protein n=1 Tax=Sesamum calycinum TaxID=2727403 RepID=A0AAW2LI71_9LAMI
MNPQLPSFPREWSKLNTDGVSKANPGVAGAGGIIRNHLGQTVLAFQEHLGLTSNTAAELKAIYRGVKLCIDSNIRKIWVATDANVALKLISSPSQGPWHLQYLLQQIRNLLPQTEFKISHIFREGNQVADYFANQACFNQHLTILSPDNITGIPKGNVFPFFVWIPPSLVTSCSASAVVANSYFAGILPMDLASVCLDLWNEALVGPLLYPDLYVLDSDLDYHDLRLKEVLLELQG